jgi:protein-S-isoprenylcysteine O-methyltransferase Ste14
MTVDWLAEIEARANAATPGPWADTPDGSYRSVVTATVRDPMYLGDETWVVSVLGPAMKMPQARANAVFMAHARADVPELVAEVRRLREAVMLMHLRLDEGRG